MEVRSNRARLVCGHPDEIDYRLISSTNAEIARDRGCGIEEAEMLRVAMARKANYENQRWPKNCIPELVAKYGDGFATYLFVDWDSFPSQNMRPCRDDEFEDVVACGVWPFASVAACRAKFGDTPMAKVALWFALEAFRRVGFHHELINDGTNGSKHRIHITAKNLSRGLLGLGWFPDGRCGDHVNQHITKNVAFGLMGLARLFCHELGHNHGEEHEPNGRTSDPQRRSVMSYTPPDNGLFYGFSTGESPYPDWLPEDRSLASLVEKYGGEYYPKDLDDDDDGDDDEDPVTPPKDDNDMDWLEVLLDALKFIRECQEKSGRAAVRSEMLDAGPRARRVARRSAKKIAVRDHGREYWRANRRDINATAESKLSSLTAAEVDDILDEANEVDD